ncbi:MAG: Lipoprotein signal peptidase [Acidimicrobiaceae bacterium]|nr:Lipoprotein signal peptidase [Acidimicrobiaceae bacterium]
MPRQRLTLRLNFTVLAVALGVSVIDALTKYWARHSLAQHGDHVVGPLWLRLQFNTGVSFSIDRSLPLVTTIVTVVIAVVVVVVGLRANRGTPTLGFGLLIGGGVANVIDRLAASPHEVTDFIAVGSFPDFNAADAAITIGFLVVMLAALRGERLLAR